MTRLNFLKDQVIETRSFINRLIPELPEELWFTIPANTDSNFAWQIGHLMLSQSFHAITSLTGRHPVIYEMMPVAEYVKLFNGMGALHRSVGKEAITVSRLKELFDRVHEVCIENLGKLPDSILDEPVPFKHPLAVTKYEALAWSYRHEMWHSAEMEAIKRELGYPIKWV